MNPNELQQLINKKTSAILPVHMLGVSSKMDEYLNIAQSANLPIVEDNCEAIGGKYNNRLFRNFR